MPEESNSKINHLKQQAKHLSVINSFVKDVLEQKNTDDVLWAIARNAIAKLEFVDCVIYLIDKKDNTLIQKAAHGSKNPLKRVILNKIDIPIGEGIVGTVAKTGKAELIGDTSLDKRYIQDDENRLSEISVPIFINNEVIGIIDSEHPKKNFFNHLHLEILQTIAAMASAKIMNIIAQEKLKSQNEQLEILVEQRTKELQKSVIKLKKSNEELGRYAHIVSHDLKQPLRTINSFVNLIKIKENNLSDEGNTYIETINNSISKMTILLDDILKYATSSTKNLIKRDVNLNEVLDTVKQSLTKQMTDANTLIEKDNLPTIHGYESLLIQLFQNIISNAIKFRQKDIPHHIYISATEHPNFYAIEITDNGIGIDSNQSQKIFNIFTKLHDATLYEGTGLGLSLCKKIVETHEGTIKVISKGKNQGCTFFFTLNK